MRRFLMLSRLLPWAFASWLHAEGPDDQFVRIYNWIQQADALAESGRNDQARQKYLQAQAELKTLQTTHPDWNDSVVGFRLKYVAEKLAPLTQKDKQPAQVTPEQKSELSSPTAESAVLVQLLQDQTRQLTADKELLQAKLREALIAQPAAVDPRELAKAQDKIKLLQKEVEVLRVNLAKAESRPDKPGDPERLEETRQALAAANQKLAQQAESVRALTLEKDALQQRLQSLINGAEIKALREENQRLERETDELNKKFRAATEESHDNKTRAKLLPLEQPAYQVAALRALPAAAGSLVAEARRAFSARRYGEAEEKYFQALRFDDKNVAILANLAETQIEQNRLAAAEDHLKRALATDPKDAFSLSVLGILKVRQEKYDEALDALSRAAQLDPQNADTFQYLGVALTKKGLREPAEAAFRRAIKLAPGHADAHHHLAVIYATRQPPSLEMARWHYQKALETGHPKDPALEKILSANKPARESK
ncbi:MAG: hypothetical protein DME22_02325 [Verrucomicrobia bacterium]|nr:MAG: hypothetical protein DME22_02325 [Verrucomicrobiota bacterium]